MGDLSRSVVTLLALVNPVICALMLLRLSGGATRRQRLRGVATVVLRTGVILLLSAVFGPRLLANLGISLDVFRIVGGLVIASIGYGMFQPESASSSPASSPASDPATAGEGMALEPVVLFAASPGTIATVLTLAVMRGPGEGLGVTVLAVLIALAITALVMALMVSRPGSAAGRNATQITRFLGLILIAMGLQFVLTNLRAFFGPAAAASG